MTTMHLDIVSAEEEIFSGNIKNIIASATMGEVGIYPKHTPMITPLKPVSYTHLTLPTILLV